jgi:CheY-like chemotaxis protein
VINQKVAVAMLGSVGYQIDTVPNGAMAVQATATQSYDAILMDCQMPEMNGYDATKAIRSQEGSGRHTPIIAMTAARAGKITNGAAPPGGTSYLETSEQGALCARSPISEERAPARSRCCAPIRRPRRHDRPVVFETCACRRRGWTGLPHQARRSVRL